MNSEWDLINDESINYELLHNEWMNEKKKLVYFW